MFSIPPWRRRRIVHEDDDLIVVDKPAGVSCHPREGDVDVATRVARTLRLDHLGLLTPLDAEASGVVLLGKHRAAQRVVSDAIAAGLPRRWVAGTVGEPRRWATVARAGRRRLVTLESRARSQPVRRWLAEAGAPAAGDRDGPDCHRLLVHLEACELPGLGRIAAPPPEVFASWLKSVPFPDALVGRFEDALELRYGLFVRSDTDAFRLVAGAGDGIDGVDLDRYGDYAVVALRSEAAVARREAICDAVASLGFAGVYLKLRPKQANVLVDTRRDEVAPAAPVRGRRAPDVLVIHEWGVPYEVRLGDGLSTGIFLDQRDGRRWLRDGSADKRVLNLFCYHAAFTVAAIAGGAAATVSVDSARPALERAAENLARLGADREAHRLVRRDAHDFLEAALRRGERFDRIVLDPPSYATTRTRGKTRVFRAERDYRPIAALCLRLLAPGGCLLACTNHRGIDPARFARLLRGAAAEAEVPIAGLTPLPDPADHPPVPGEPCHLKRVVVEVAR